MRDQNYYFFAATLAPINYGDEPPISSEKFRELCLNYLSPEDASFLEYCYFDSKLAMETLNPTGSEFIDDFMLQQRSFFLYLASLRASKMGRQLPADDMSGMKQLAENNPAVQNALEIGKEAFEMSDPLEAELFINKGRWQSLDTLINMNYFDVRNIYCYLLRLQLLERKRFFDTQKGTEEYQKLYDTILNEYNTKTKEVLL